jgi:hypothetical protein
VVFLFLPHEKIRAVAGEFNHIITLIGLAILTPYFFYFLYYQHKRRIRIKNRIVEENKKFQNFLKKSKKTALNLDEVKIISLDGKNLDFYNTTIGKIEDKKTTPKQVKIELMYHNNKIPYTFTTTKNIYNLKMHFTLRKETFIYDNNGDIYIDFDFLK